MSDALISQERALPSVEKARALLAECRSTHEVRKIRAISQAVATLERGKEIAIDAGEIVVWADRRIGELSAELPKVPPKESGRAGGKGSPSSGPPSKSASLASLGLTKQQASEAEKVARLPEKDMRAYLAASRKAGQVPSSSGAATLGKLPPASRERALAKLGDVPDVRRAISAIRREAKPPKKADAGPDLGEPDDPRAWRPDDFIRNAESQIAEWIREWRSHEGKSARLVGRLRLLLDLEEKRDE